MAAGARGVRAMLHECFAQGQVAELGLVGWQHRHVRRRRGNVFAEQPVNDPVATLHRARAQAGRVLGQENRHRQQSAPRVLLRFVYTNPVPFRRLRHPVVPGENRVDERVVAVQEIEDGSVPLNDVEHEADRLLEHGFAQLGREGWEPLAVHGVVFLEPADVEPVAGKLGRQAADAGVPHHPTCLGGEHVGFVQIAGRRMFHQLLVRHARPEEVAQTAGECIVGEGRDVRCLAHRSSFRALRERRRVDAVAEVRRHQHAGHRVANRVFMTEMLTAQRMVESEEVVRLRLGERTAIRPPRERQQRVEMSRFGGRPGPLERAHVAIHLFEIIADDSRGHVVGHLLRPGQVHVGQLRHLRFGGDLIVFGAERVELRRGHEAWRLGALEPDELLELPDRRERDEIELLPKAVQLALLRGIEDELVQRTIVAEISHLAVEAGAQQTMALRIRCDLARVGEEHAAAFRDIKPIGEQRAEAGERRFISRLRLLRVGNTQ